MGIFGAMTTAVSGIRAQSFALENIAGNIANSRTTGFKRVDSSFVDLIPEAPRQRELAGSVQANSSSTNTIQGDISATGIGTNVALNGEGFFVVQERTSFAGGNPVFGGADLFTRRGDFVLDRNGYLVNGAGYYLKGLPLDPATGAQVGSAAQILQVSTDNLPARRSTQIEYRANLPLTPATANASASVPGSELLPIALFAVDPRPPSGGGAGFIQANESTQFVNNSIAGGAVTVYSDSGAPVNVQLRWAKLTNTAGANTWAAYYQENATAAGVTPQWRALDQVYTFNANGQLTSPVSLPGTTFTVNGVNVGPTTFTVGAVAGLTQFSDSNGQVNVNTLRQDGFPSGQLDSIGFGDGGRIVGNFSNGQVVGLAQISVAQFQADNFLKRRDGGAFEQTLESGEPILVDGGRSVVGGSLENSNADIADEFSKMIVTQQAYSANTRVISTSQQMLQDIINIVR